MSAELQLITLAECEAVIERGLATFIEVGNALIRIRDGRLYRDTHATFEDYCQKRWGWTGDHGKRLIDAARIAQILPDGGISNEAQARELVPLRDNPEVLRSVWGSVVDRAEATETPITAPLIRAAVRDYIRGQAAQSEAEIQAAAAGWTDEQRAAVAPELMRQRGELMRLIRDINRLPEPVGYALAHREHLPPDAAGEVYDAWEWLETFWETLEDRHGAGN